MRRHRRIGLLGVVCCAALIAASCGDDDDDDTGGGTTATTAADGGTATTAADGGTATTATDGGTATTAADGGTATTAADGGTATTAAGGSPGDDLDGEYGLGATAFQDAVNATADAPLAAEGEPFVISMPNLEGDAGGSFPDFREGAEAAVQLINDQLGGIGADYAAGTPGRPIELNVCSHGLTPEAAQSCANDIVGQEPNLIAVGIDFFTPAMYPAFAELPIIQMLPIFVEDFIQQGAFSAIGGCPTAFFGAANYLATVGYDKVAVMYSDNGPGQQCWTDTTERPLQYFVDQGQIAEFRGFANLPGDPSDDAAQFQEVAGFLEGAENPAVFYSVQSTDCVDWARGLRASGVEADLVMGSACVDDTVLGLPETVGTTFEFQSYNPDGDLAEFPTFELDVRSTAIEAYGPTAPVGTFMEDAFGSIVWAWQIANYMLEQGQDPWDRTALGAALVSLPPFHFVGRPPVDCSGNPEEYPAICFRKSTWLEWDGEAFGPGQALDGEYFDLTELMGEVAAANPR
jgi:hypothetical protein